LRNEVLVARAAARPPTFEKELEQATEGIEEGVGAGAGFAREIPLLKQQIREGLKSFAQNVPPGYEQSWKIDLGFAKNFLRNQPLFLRVKFNTAQKSPSGTFDVFWRVGVPKETQVLADARTDESGAGHIPRICHSPRSVRRARHPDGDGGQSEQCLVALHHGRRDRSVVSRRRVRAELRPRAGNHFLLDGAAGDVGLAAASFLSFPVAAFVSVAALLVVFSAGTLASAVADGTVMGVDEESGVRGLFGD
jgi:hypothetical protein